MFCLFQYCCGGLCEFPNGIKMHETIVTILCSISQLVMRRKFHFISLPLNVGQETLRKENHQQLESMPRNQCGLLVSGQASSVCVCVCVLAWRVRAPPLLFPPLLLLCVPALPLLWWRAFLACVRLAFDAVCPVLCGLAAYRDIGMLTTRQTSISCINLDTCGGLRLQLL